MKRKIVTICLMGLMVASAQAACDNLIVNGDFELGTTGVSSDYTYATPDYNELWPEAYYTVYTNTNASGWVHILWTDYGDHTSGSGQMLIVNGAEFVTPGSEPTVWGQDVTVEQNKIYTLTYYLRTCYPESPATLRCTINDIQVGPDAVAPATPGDGWLKVSYEWDSESNTLAEIRLLDLNYAHTGNDFTIDDISLSPPCIEKEMTSGPEEIGIYLPDPTEYEFVITYSGPEAVVVDTVPAEFEVTDAVATSGTATYERANKKTGPKAKSATIITWNVPAGLDQTLTVTIETRQSPGKGHGKKGMTVYKPTSCGPLAINDGATAYDPEAYALGDLVILAGPTDPCEVEAVCGEKPCTPTCLGVSFVDPNLLVDWNDVCVGGDPVVYNVYHSVNGSDFTMIAEDVSVSEYEHGGLTLSSGDEHCYKIEAEYVGADPGYESGKSEEDCCYTVP